MLHHEIKNIGLRTQGYCPKFTINNLFYLTMHMESNIISRTDAENQGLKYYFTGIPCKRGHISKRFVHSRNCYHCSLIQTKQWIIDNPTYMSDWYTSNTDDVIEKSRAYRTNNPDKIRSQVAKRRCIKQQAIPSWYESDLVDILYHRAIELSASLGCTLEIDHIIPLNSKTVCGLHCWSNLQLLDKSLNGHKGNKYQSDW